ncbi:MAG: ABC transporter ATP-binding protein [Paracoccus denitrificans]|uniref:ABC transporter ATP-binding protein n=1 Tax=Paracoccus denitrificans TaxID=266 RepID=A0A533I1U0_PARDE|nr:MAG: ABC transporter ATP-binding protein [Paracoccus denitrificans]
MTKALCVTELSAGYRGKPVLDRLNLQPLQPGTITALVGPNAAGKSTLLRSLAGLHPATGRIDLGELDLNRLSLAERACHVGFMPQSLPQRTELSVLEAVVGALQSAPIGTGRLADNRRRAVEVLDWLNILDLAMDGIGRLSGGQRQLASLAQAIVRKPRVLLLDEPTSALDLRHQFDVMSIVREIANSGCIVIVVLHDLTLAASWVDHLVVLDGGQIAAEGAPEIALTPEILSAVYKVQARVERCSRGRLQISVDGPRPEDP